MIKVGINGFGRIGRFVFRAAMKRNDIQIVGINDLCPVDYLAYMLKYDTMHGQFDGTIEADVENSKLIVNGQSIRITAERNPADLKWDAVGAEYVVESTGLFLSKDKAQAHIEAGAKYVVMSAPSNLAKLTVKSTTDTSKVGTRIDIPVNLPFKAGITLPTALAAPVEEGIMLPEAARPPLQSFIEGPSTVF